MKKHLKSFVILSLFVTLFFILCLQNIFATECDFNSECSSDEYCDRGECKLYSPYKTRVQLLVPPPTSSSSSSSSGASCAHVTGDCTTLQCCTTENLWCLNMTCCRPVGGDCRDRDDCCNKANVTCDLTNSGKCVQCKYACQGPCTHHSQCCIDSICKDKTCCRPGGYLCIQSCQCCTNSCTGPSGNKKCTCIKQLGQPCMENYECCLGSGEICDPDKRKCCKRTDSGPCTSNADCCSNICNLMTGKCVASLCGNGVKNSGEECDPPTTGVSPDCQASHPENPRVHFYSCNVNCKCEEIKFTNNTIKNPVQLTIWTNR